MATLDSFGFAKGKRNRQQVKASQEPLVCAFVPPSFGNDLIKKKPLEIAATIATKKKPNKKTDKKTSNNNNRITQYFAPMLGINTMDTNGDQEDEPAIICTIRRKMSIIDEFWNVILSEYSQELLEEDEEMPEATLPLTVPVNKRKRDFVAAVSTKKKKTIEIELSDIMKNFLNIQERCRLNDKITVGLYDKALTTERDEDEKEDMTRTLKRKLTISQSNALILQITNELLYSLY